jgi:CRISPR-associated protein Cas1
MLKGRLGLESARVPHADRHGLVWLGRGRLYVESGTLRFLTAGFGDLPPGDYAIPFQLASCLILQPGTTVTHDSLRLLARHDCGAVFAGENGVRFYASLPAGPDSARRARRHVELWADRDARIRTARRMYAWRLGEVLMPTDMNALRGIEGARMKQTYRRLAEQYGVDWSGRRYNRDKPDRTDPVNLAINHASSALEGAALVAIAATGALPQLGFIHEDPGHSFALDLSDLFRDSVLLPVAFEAAKAGGSLERAVREKAGKVFREKQIVVAMIDKIKEIFDADDPGRDA